MATIEDELHALDVKLKTLKLDYEQYFCGSRPREPRHLRSEVQKIVTTWLNTPIPNTAQRFKFNTLNSRFQTFKRQWDNTLRQIENGTYERHLFKAKMHERARGIGEPAAARSRSGAAPASSSGAGFDDLFSSYRDAAMACGQDVSKLTPDKLRKVVEKQEGALRSKLGGKDVDFRVVVEKGKVKLKASARK